MSRWLLDRQFYNKQSVGIKTMCTKNAVKNLLRALFDIKIFVTWLAHV